MSRLERAGRLRRTLDDDDRRRRVVTLTSGGEDLLAEVERRSNARMNALSAHLRPSQKKELLRSMESIRLLLDREGAM